MSRPSLVPELYVSSLDASLQFYVDLLGFQVEYERKAEGFCCLSLDGAWLMLEQVSDRSPASSHELAEGRWLTARLERPFGRGVNFEITVADLASATGLSPAPTPWLRLALSPESESPAACGPLEAARGQSLLAPRPRLPTRS